MHTESNPASAPDADEGEATTEETAKARLFHSRGSGDPLGRGEKTAHAASTGDMNMIELPVYNKNGEEVGTFSIDEQSLGGDVRYALLKQAYVAQHANRRQGSAKTKGRGEVEGSTRKLYRQKGTGNARVGNARTVVRRGGGVAFAKDRRREDFQQKFPKRMRRLANRNALLAKAIDQEIKIIDDLRLDRPRTKDVASLLGAVGVNRSCLIALDKSNDHAALAARNLDDVDTVRWDQLNAFELLNHRFLIIEKESLQSFIDGEYLTEENREQLISAGKGDA